MKKYVRPIVLGTIILGLGVASWFGYKGKTSQTPDNTQVPEGAQDRYSETATPQATATSTEISNPSGQIFSSDGTGFNVISTDPFCAEISGSFTGQPGGLQNAGRLAQALGNGKITFYRDGKEPITIDTDADPFPDEVSMVHIGDYACKER